MNEFNELNNYGQSENRYLTYEDVEKIAASKVRGSILWMVFGLLISGVTGYFTLKGLYAEIIPYQIVMVSWALEFVAVIAFTALTFKASANVLRTLYDPYVIISAFSGTVILFTILAIYGYITKEDLSKFKPILIVGLIALIVMGLINIFLQSEGLIWISSMLGVAVFIVFIAYDVNRIKNNVIAYAMEEDASILDKIEIHGALALYLDFVNLFIYLLRILGRRK